MRLRKFWKFCLIFLMILVGLLVVIFVGLNLPFSQRFATRQVNQILHQAKVPVHIDAIRQILPGSVYVEGVVLSDPHGDTVIFAGGLEASIRLAALLRNKVAIREVRLDRAEIDITRKSNESPLNIEAAFQAVMNQDTTAKKDEHVSWEISIKRGGLSNVSFRMSDSVAGIHIAQDVSEIEIKNFRISLLEREIFCKSLGVSGAKGFMNLTPSPVTAKENEGSPWNLGLQELSLNHIDFTYQQAADSLKLETTIGIGSIRANKLDLLARTADLSKIQLKDVRAILHTGNHPQKPEGLSEGKKGQFQWNILSKAVEIENATVMVGPEPGENFQRIDLSIKDFRLDDEQSGMEVKKMNFQMGNGFSLNKMKGELVSKDDYTQLNLEIETGHSRMGLEGFADRGFLDILSAPEELESASLKMVRTEISLDDLSYFKSNLEGFPYESLLSSSPIHMGGTFNLANSVFSVSGFTVSQRNTFNIDLEGSIENPFHLSKATADVVLEISGFDQSWLESLVNAFGVNHALPDLPDLKIQARVSDSLRSPDINVALTSHAGSVDLYGSLDLDNKRFSMGYAFHSVALGQLLSLPELGTFTGTGEIKGAGFSVETLKSDFYLQIDTLGFKAYNYKGVLLVGALGQGEYELNMVAKDSSLKGELKVVLTLADSAVIVDASGVMMAQLNELHFYNDTLAIETAVEAHLAMRGMELESKISTTGTTFTTPRESATVQQLTATFRTDKVESVLHAEADFFHVDMHLMRPLNELKSLGNEFKDYFVSFRDPSHITTADRLSALPEINAMGQIYPNDILDIFLEDSGIHFTNLDFSITCKPEEDRLNAYIQGGEMAYKSLKTGKLNAAITDSAGIILLEILAEKSSFNSGPENRIKLAGEFSNRSTLTTLSVDDSTNQNVYFIEVAGKADSSKIVLEIPSQQLTLNRVQWQMESPDLLSIDLATGTVSPTLRINRDSSFMHVHTLNQNQILSYRVDLNKVELGSLLRRGLFPGRPDGTFTGSVDYSASMDSEKKIAAGLHISDIRYSQQDFSDIQLDGSLILGQPDAYSIDLLAKMDSSYVQLTGGKVESGDRSIKAEFSHFPLITIQPFTEEYLSELGGFISGKFNISSVKGSEQANGELNFKDASVKVNILNNTFKIPSQRIQLTDERVVFSDFTVLDTLNKKLHVDGFVDFGGTNPVSADLNISSSKLKVMSRDKKSRAPFTGNVFVDSRFSVKGPLTNPRVEGRILLAEGTEIFYQQREDLRMSESERIVNFVSHNETGEEIKPPTIIRQSSFMNSGIETIVEIDPSTRINFTLDNRMFSIDLDVKGGGEVQYDMLKNEQVTLSGKYVIGEGAALINLVGWPNKSFQLTKGGYIRWDGRVENPELNFEAENTVSSSYINPVDGKRRDVKFNVILQMTGYLTDLNVLFTIRTPDQYVMSILNTMSPEEKMRQAISVLLFEAIDLPGISSSTDYMTQQVNQILASQLNQLTKSTIKGVDISFGLNSYDQSSQQGGSEPSTSLSYEVRKSLLNNRGQIEVSGRLHDLNQGLGASDHSLTNVSFEYRLDSTANKFLKVYNEHTYDDVFEGEVTKTGIGFTYRKRYRSFREIWKHKK